MNDERFKQAADAFERLCRTMATLRAPGGCPWDREQTFASLKPYLIEEAYETVDAMDAGEPKAHCEELGDLLLQVVFQAEIAQETGNFSAADVVDGINQKLIRRHPHVFSDAAPAAGAAATAGGTMQSWETIKAGERAPGKGRLDGVPRAMPGLLRAYRTGEKAAAVGFDWPDVKGSRAKVQEEWGELEEAMATPTERGPIEDEMGDVFFALVNLCRHLQLDPEAALGRTIAKFQRRFRYVEQSMEKLGKPLQDATLDQLNALWEDAKSRERP